MISASSFCYSEEAQPRKVISADMIYLIARCVLLLGTLKAFPGLPASLHNLKISDASIVLLQQVVDALEEDVQHTPTNSRKDQRLADCIENSRAPVRCSIREPPYPQFARLCRNLVFSYCMSGSK